MKFELHVHTRFSKDSLLCFWPLYLKCRLLNISVIAITEHNNINGGMAFKEFCKKHGEHIFVITGEEIFTSEGEIIGLYLKKNIQGGMSAEESICEIKRQGGIVYIPHPYDEKRYKTVLKESVISEKKEDIDCIEVHNGRNILIEYDKKQRAIAERHNLTPIIGSDAHTWIEIGRNYLEVKQLPDSPESFKTAICDAVFHSRKSIKISHQITKFAKMIRLVKEGKLNELYRAVIRKIKRGQYRGS